MFEFNIRVDNEHREIISLKNSHTFKVMQDNEYRMTIGLKDSHMFEVVKSESYNFMVVCGNMYSSFDNWDRICYSNESWGSIKNNYSNWEEVRRVKKGR